MKLLKLIVHQKPFSGEDLIINPKDYSGIKKGDVVEIYHPDDEFSRLLLQVTSFKEDLQTRETISVESNIASMFQLRTFNDVYMNIVNPDDVALDSVELTFKDQYMGRSEMWRLKNSLVNTCVYMNKKIEFCGGSIRCQVYEMWSQGDRVACGVITDDTKIVFRSSTSMVYLFIQMSSEMWDFDIHGDLYFEKAVNGFLADLFQKWKKNGCNHEVTIVLFSRTFYNASKLDEFPHYMRECLQQDYRGRFYEDFYRVAVQNERYEDWSNVLVQLRKLFTDYQKIVLEYHCSNVKSEVIIPKASNSTAAQGNFLEVLNMSLNVFEKHYLDRSFDRTGQLSVVITPGVGVFEVDRELTNVTKQRIIDNGVGSDLVCVGEQPLHAVPLLKFHNKDSSMNVPDDYSMPHWINLSFYSTNKKIPNSTFIPRIKLPQRISKNCCEISNGKLLNNKTKLLQEESREYLHNSFFDYDAYDAQVFQLPPIHTSSLQRKSTRTKKTSVVCMETHNNAHVLKLLKRKMSDPDIHHPPPESHPIVNSTSRSAAISIPLRCETVTSNGSNIEATAASRMSLKSDITDNEISPPFRPVVGSAGSPNGSATAYQPMAGVRPSRALINPFDPSHVTIKLTSNRRRWTHIFPKGPTGVLIQQHHYQAVPATQQQQHQQQHHHQQRHEQNNDATSMLSSSPVDPNYGYANNQAGLMSRSASQICFNDHTKSKSRMNLPLTNTIDKRTSGSKSLTLLWGATGEQEWTPALTTGVDWKSLTISACLPITTDYFPDKRSLQNDYVVSDYNLLPDDVNADFAQQRAIYRKPLSTAEVFKELVSQRLAQGFQLIILPPSKNQITTPGSNSVPPISSVMRGRQTDSEHKEEYLLSIGRIFHKISLSGNAISVTRYRPRHPYPPFNIHYRYRFHAPFHDTYEVSWVSFATEKLETYNWNYLDHYICTRGDTDFALVEALKYWRFRVFLLPLHNHATRKIQEGSPHCDIYIPPTQAEQITLMDGFLRFIEGWLNKIRRPHSNKNLSPTALGGPLPRDPASHLTRRRHSTSLVSLTNQQNNLVGNSPFRERLGSNRLPEKPRPRSGSKVMDRGRVSPASEVVLPLAIEQQQQDHLEVNDENFVPEVTKIKSTSPATEILEAMKHPHNGVGFLTQHPSLPSQTFVSADAVQWLNSHIEGGVTVENAITIMKGMIQEKLICHASGDFSKPFMLGFYLYHIVQDKDSQKGVEYSPPLGDLQSFENEWVEIEMRAPKGWCEPQSNASSSSLLSNISHPISIPSCDNIDESDVPVFLRNDLDLSDVSDERDYSVPMYKHTHLDIDINNKSDRVEWGHLRYQSILKADHSYELVVQWMAASGSVVSDLIFIWQRKAQLCGIQMIPVPSDLLALPFTTKSDPLRGPIFIPLDTECLMAGKRYLFEELREDTYAQRLFLFQEAILQRFGFVRCLVEGNENAHQYVHVSGNAFILVPSTISPRPRQHTGANIIRRNAGQKRYPIHAEQPSPHEAYITRHVSGKNKDDYNMDRRMGFLWSWNHMLSRKWKYPTLSTGDELFQKKIIQDFRHFCSNGDNRLKRFWDSCWELKEKFCTNAK
ncbi:GATOR complex protein Iml1 isoform X1 [Phymastichus coffea]|uniref:GATOR complex protein Iml1 isoform X1 n=1 Tax=Phymastichus coffea TaxID=108790 RepID=UPI00273C80E7|nr:GATOR complex protein Iml1 isoform X1 [Phymastichus coffea]XP_058807767.1 GATOR complex protein Iml1 isoform X1 [Phymastichus coffea]XP_058807768.1 GATOR complex protein Iml1 isoform X1 [Phymastichus coffea]XP_058807769.1 GATOR complex protein Iml1 isoform X1 [Phymastichus coffea]